MTRGLHISGTERCALLPSADVAPTRTPALGHVEQAPVDPFAGTAYEDSPEGWWTPFGGALDVASGVVYLPRGSMHVPCPWTDCKNGCLDTEGMA